MPLVPKRHGQCCRCSSDAEAFGGVPVGREVTDDCHVWRGRRASGSGFPSSQEDKFPEPHRYPKEGPRDGARPLVRSQSREGPRPAR
jgi:hypothetical protein